VSVTLGLSVGAVTTQAAVIVALAVVALVLTGWRQTARAQPRSHRGSRIPTRRGPVEVEQSTTTLYRRPGPIRRLFALAASGGITVVTGMMLATIVGFAAAWIVITLTSLLKQ
jgi:hypothetical protein